MAEWCVQCGVDHKPMMAIGLDEDGEPACLVHQARGHQAEDREETMASPTKDVRPRSKCEVCGREIANFMMLKHMRAAHGNGSAGNGPAAQHVQVDGRADGGEGNCLQLSEEQVNRLICALPFSVKRCIVLDICL